MPDLEHEITRLARLVKGSADVRQRAIETLRFVLTHEDVAKYFRLGEATTKGLHLEGEIDGLTWSHLLIINADGGGLKIEAEGNIANTLRARLPKVHDLQSRIGRQMIAPASAESHEKVRVLLCAVDSTTAIGEERTVVLEFMRGIVELLSDGRVVPRPSASAAGTDAESSRGSQDTSDLERQLDQIEHFDLPGSAKRRAEQRILRNLVVDRRKEAPCSICGRVFPVELLVLAHVKPRAACSEDQKRDYKNNTMLACTFGFDELFERHYIEVQGGRCTPGVAVATTETVRAMVSWLMGKPCQAWSDGSAQYFEWHAQSATSGTEESEVPSLA